MILDVVDLGQTKRFLVWRIVMIFQAEKKIRTMHIVLHISLHLVLRKSSFLSPPSCRQWSLFPTGCASIAPCIEVLVGHVGIRTLVATTSWSNLELAACVGRQAHTGTIRRIGG